jgi:hypothetical protein
MTETQTLLNEIEQFLADHQMAATTFGNRACGDLHAVRRLRQGLGLTVRRAERLRQFMREYKPARPSQRPLAGAAA